MMGVGVADAGCRLLPVQGQPGLQKLSCHAHLHMSRLLPCSVHQSMPRICQAFLEAPWSFRSAQSYPIVVCRLFTLSTPKRVGLRNSRPFSLQHSFWSHWSTHGSWLQASFSGPMSRIITCNDRFQHELVDSQNRKCKQLPGFLLSPGISQAGDTAVGL